MPLLSGSKVATYLVPLDKIGDEPGCNQRYKPERPMPSAMDILTIAFYIVLFVLAFMIARIIMKIMRGY
jgi:hypothetical protein